MRGVNIFLSAIFLMGSGVYMWFWLGVPASEVLSRGIVLTVSIILLTFGILFLIAVLNKKIDKFIEEVFE